MKRRFNYQKKIVFNNYIEVETSANDFDNLCENISDSLEEGQISSNASILAIFRERYGEENMRCSIDKNVDDEKFCAR